MKSLTKLFVCTFVAGALLGCDGYTTYKAKIVNESSSEIINIDLAMIGVEKKVVLDKLAPGAKTELYEFKLKNWPRDKPVPISYGDYVGNYTQKGEHKTMHVSSPAKEITIKIDDQSFSIEKVTVN
jgi:hypothetical protein